MPPKLRKKLYEIVFNADTPAGRAFDIALMIVILLSILTVMLESVDSINRKYIDLFNTLEWVITAVFTFEYFLRIYLIRRPALYIFSFYGIIDFLSIVPAYLAVFISGAHGLVVIRALRLLRIFRILKLNRHVNESAVIVSALKASRAKILVFLYSVVMIVIIIGTLMYLIEGAANGFTSIPRSIYWAIVTLTTVGYGDIAPQTIYGQTLASFVMILGYAIIAVPTGIVTAEISQSVKGKKTADRKKICLQCEKSEHDPDAVFCKYCGTILKQKNN